MQFKAFQLFIAGAIISLAAAASDKPVLSGTWMLDSGLSSGDVPQWASMTVVQTGHRFRMAQNDRDGRVVRSFEGECKTDGRFHPVQGGEGGSIECKWDGATLMTHQHWNDNHNERSVRTTVTADGNMVQEIHEVNSGSEKDARLVWRRQ